MAKKLKSTLSILLAIVILISAIPITTASATSTMTVTVSTKNAMAGQTAEIDVAISNNPGIAALSFDIDYDKDNLILKGFTYNDEALYGASTTPYNANASTPCLFMVNGTQNITGDFKFATLTFEVKESAKNNTSAYIKLTYDPDNVYDIAENNIDCTVVNGAINIIACVPGDINGDEKVNSKDVSRLMQYHAHWDVEVNEPALDTNGDGKLNSKDVTRLMQYLAHWDVEIYPTIDFSENLTEIPAVAASCETEGNINYWFDDAAGKYYRDAKGIIEIDFEDTIIPATGHTPVTDPAIPATYESTGLTEGSHCSVCEKVLVAQEEIPKLEKNEYSIVYHIDNNDNYLKTQIIENKNPATYTTEDGLLTENENNGLYQLFVEGYDFKGWFTEQTEGQKVDTIPKGTVGTVVLYAHWEKVVYHVYYDSPDVPIPSDTYTVDTGMTVINPSWFGYTFVGWSIEEHIEEGDTIPTAARIVNSIPVGTTGNITLHANWTSNRNKTKSVSELAAPNIIEDLDNDQYLFVYEIGAIENVPLSLISNLGYSEGMSQTVTKEYSKTVSEGSANTIAKTVSNATTKTSTWTLSEDWSTQTACTDQHDEEVAKSKEKRDSTGSVIGSKYYVSNSSGGSSSFSRTAGENHDTTAKVSEGNSTGMSASVGTQQETSRSKSLNVSASVEAKTKIPGASLGVSGTVGGSEENKVRDQYSTNLEGSRTKNKTQENINNDSSHWETNSSSSSTWNSTSGYENSKTTSKNTEVSEAISEVVADRYSYTSTEGHNTSQSNTASTSDSQQLSDEYASTVEYCTEDRGTDTITRTIKSSATGYFRLVYAGTVHVFAVVGYDIATNSYFTYTYSVLDKETYEYLDYSKSDSEFKDCENGCLPFDIPYEVHEYISSKIARSPGLVFEIDIDSKTGSVIEYDDSPNTNGMGDSGNESIGGETSSSTVTSENDGISNSEYVVIPEYVSIDNHDGTRSAIRIRSIDENTFKGNTNIKSVFMSKFIYEIPSHAFEDCTSLERVFGFGITDIGDDAFSGCTSLEEYEIDKYISSLGDNAFENVARISVSAKNESVVDATINSGAYSITLNVSEMDDGQNLDDKKIYISDSIMYFALLSTNTRTICNNLQIESKAKETYINNIWLTNNASIPLKIDSETLILNRVSVEDCPGFALVLLSESTNIKLYGTITLSSVGDNAVISKNAAYSKLDPEVAGKLNLTGNYLICDSIDDIINSKMVNTLNGEIKPISSEEYEAMLSSIIVSFDSNGGNIVSEKKAVSFGQYYGELPTPSRTNYVFNGWYTIPEGGEQITSLSTVSSLINQTLYAQWSPKAFTITFNANGGSVDTISKELVFGEAYGELPEPYRDYFDFDGWYTSSEGGELVNYNTIATTSNDLMIYAHWKEHSDTDWVLASQMPVDAKVTAEKWTYVETTTATSSSNSMSGYELYDTTWVWSSYGSWSSWSTDKVTSSDSREVGTRKQYFYDRWIGTYNGSTRYGPTKASISACSNIRHEESGWLNSAKKDAGKTASGYQHYEGMWYNQKTRTQYRYRDRSKVYTYYFRKIENKESLTAVTASDNISNVQHWVKYIPKSNNDNNSEFYALIINKNSGKPIENDNTNVVLRTENHTRNQIWKFITNDDGSYSIISLLDDRALDLSGYGTADGTNIQTCTFSGNDAQRWYFYDDNGGYHITPKCSPNGVMDLTSGSTEDGTNVQFYSYNGTNAQIFVISKIANVEAYLQNN